MKQGDIVLKTNRFGYIIKSPKNSKVLVKYYISMGKRSDGFWIVTIHQLTLLDNIKEVKEYKKIYRVAKKYKKLVLMQGEINIKLDTLNLSFFELINSILNIRPK